MRVGERVGMRVGDQNETVMVSETGVRRCKGFIGIVDVTFFI